MNVKSSMVKVNRSDDTNDHIRLFSGWRRSMAEQKPRIPKSKTTDEMPIAASSFILGIPLSVVMITSYGAFRVLTPGIPNAVGICVDIMVILAAVTNAEIGM